MKRILFYLLIGWTCAAALCSCRASRTPTATPHAVALARPDSTQLLRPDSSVVQPHRSGLDKLLGRPARPAVTTVGAVSIRTGKKATITNYYAPATVSSTQVGKKGSGAAGPGAVATTVTKPSGPVATAPAASATDNRKAGQRGGAAATAPHASATATTEKQHWLAAMLPFLGVVAGIGLVYWLVAGGGALVVAGWFRKKKTPDTLS
jgi:hypothetical protein